MSRPTLSESAGLSEPPPGLGGRLALWFATGFGSGRLPLAPGAWGTLLVGVPLWALLYVASRLLPGWDLEACGVAIVLIAALAATRRVLGHAPEGPGSSHRDPKGVVADEVAGYLIAAYALTPLGAAVAFVLFRVLDVVKPWPACTAERLGGAVGVVTDDLIAGLYTAIGIRIVAALWPAAALLVRAGGGA
jgi:phosphatidylglycerophosphatase A